MVALPTDLIEDYLYGKAKRTKEQYTICFSRFLTYLQLDGPLPEQATQFRTKAKTDETWAQQQLISFIILLHEEKVTAEGKKKKKIATETVNNYYKAIKVFCDLHSIRLEWKRIRRYIGKVRKRANDRAPYPEEIKMWVQFPEESNPLF